VRIVVSNPNSKNLLSTMADEEADPAPAPVEEEEEAEVEISVQDALKEVCCTRVAWMPCSGAVSIQG
jgi:hypothetical protein